MSASDWRAENDRVQDGEPPMSINEAARAFIETMGTSYSVIADREVVSGFTAASSPAARRLAEAIAREDARIGEIEARMREARP